MTTNQVVDGYMVLVYQLGHVSLFAIVFPLVYLFSPSFLAIVFLFFVSLFAIVFPLVCVCARAHAVCVCVCVRERDR